MPESGDANELTHQAAADESPEVQRQSRTKSTEEDAIVGSPTCTAEENGDDVSAEHEKQEDKEACLPQVEGSTAGEGDERAKVERRRRRRCPVIDVDTYSSDGESSHEGTGKQRSLARAVTQKDAAGVKRLLREGANVWDADSHGWTALHWACSRGSAVMTTILLQAVGEHEQDVNTSDRSDSLNAVDGINGWTALHLAAIGGHLDVVYLLMAAGCDANIKDVVGDRPINCVKRATKKRRGLAMRLRNALLDLSDTDSGDDDTTAPRRS